MYGSMMQRWNALRRNKRLVLALVLLFFFAMSADSARAHGLEPWQDEIIINASVKYDVWYYKLKYTIHCESNHFDMDVITGHKLGKAREIGAVQLHPSGLLPDFYVRGYDNPRSFTQSVDYLAMKVAENPRNRFAWSCYPR